MFRCAVHYLQEGLFVFLLKTTCFCKDFIYGDLFHRTSYVYNFFTMLHTMTQVTIDYNLAKNICF